MQYTTIIKIGAQRAQRSLFAQPNPNTIYEKKNSKMKQLVSIYIGHSNPDVFAIFAEMSASELIRQNNCPKSAFRSSCVTKRTVIFQPKEIIAKTHKQTM